MPFNPNTVIPTSISADNCTTACNSCARIKDIYAMSNDSNYIYLDDENAYHLRQQAYQLLKDSMQLMYGGSIYDADLQNFFMATKLSNIGALSNISELLNNNQFATAALINGNFSENNLMESNASYLNEICANYYEDTVFYNEAQKSQLLTIAYEYPGIGGRAVYQARAILNLDLDDTRLNYRMGDLSDSDEKINIYPNPSKGIFTLEYALEKEETATYEIYDMVGKKVDEGKLKEFTPYFTLDLSKYEPGLYNLKILSSQGRCFDKKLNYIK